MVVRRLRHRGECALGIRHGGVHPLTHRDDGAINDDELALGRTSSVAADLPTGQLIEPRNTLPDIPRQGSRVVAHVGDQHTDLGIEGIPFLGHLPGHRVLREAVHDRSCDGLLLLHGVRLGTGSILSQATTLEVLLEVPEREVLSNHPEDDVLRSGHACLRLSYLMYFSLHTNIAYLSQKSIV